MRGFLDNKEVEERKENLKDLRKRIRQHLIHGALFFWFIFSMSVHHTNLQIQPFIKKAILEDVLERGMDGFNIDDSQTKIIYGPIGEGNSMKVNVQIYGAQKFYINPPKMLLKEQKYQVWLNQEKGVFGVPIYASVDSVRAL